MSLLRFKLATAAVALVGAVVFAAPSQAAPLHAAPAPSASADGLSAGPSSSASTERAGAFHSGRLSVAAGTGYFDWDADIKVGVFSRIWTQKAGNTTVYVNGPCYVGQNPDKYGITIHYSTSTQSKPVYYSSLVPFQCGKSLQYTFANMPAGSFKFFLSKANDGVEKHVTGAVRYVS